MSTHLIDNLVEPLAECMTLEAARKIAGLRADAETQARLDELAAKANFGTLTDAEKAEYDRFLGIYHVISILQAKARKLLKDQPG